MKLKIVVAFLIASIAFMSCKDNSKTSETTEPIQEEIIDPEIITTVNMHDDRAELVEKVKAYITKEYLTEADLRAISEDDRKFQLQEIDLNNNGKNEIFVNFMTPYFCGTGGCSILLLNDKIEPITKFTVTRTPIYAEENVENGWRVLLTQSEGKWRKLIYKDESYPTNPSMVETTKEAASNDAEVIFGEGNENMKTYSF